MAFVSRGFRGRRRADGPPGRVPPGQYVVTDFPVLSAGPTPDVPLDEWRFTIAGEVDEPRLVDLGRVPGAAERARHGRHPLRHQVVQARHHLGGRVAGHPAGRASRPRPSTCWCARYGGYTTNLPLEDLLDGKAWVAYAYDGEPLEPEHGGPARLLVPHLYFWKSAKWVRGHRAPRRRTSPASGRPTATTTTVTHGANSGTRATDLAGRRGGGRGRRDAERAHACVSTAPAGRGTCAGQHVDVRLTARGRLPGPAQLLDRLAGRRRAA